VAGATVFSRRAARPLRDVVDAAARITRGEWTRRVPVRGSSEAAAMAVAFNEMTATLTDAEHRAQDRQGSRRECQQGKDQFLANISPRAADAAQRHHGHDHAGARHADLDEQREYMSIIDTSARGSWRSSTTSGLREDRRRGADARPAPVRSAGLFEHTRRVLWPLANARSLELLYDVDAALPAQLVGDETRLRQIVLNLAGNAIKFTPGRTRAGPRARSGRADSSNAAVVLRVEVTDTGIGIPKDRQAAIFDTFVQADGSSTRRYGGTGLGLTICARLVAMMGGTISVASEPGPFHVRLLGAASRESTQSAAGRVARSITRTGIGARPGSSFTRAAPASR
jgi:signal transduction histidine kinase